VETLRAAAEVAAAVALVVVEALEVPLHVPKPVWQPVPQCPVVEPQKLYWEQQSPKVEPRQVVLPVPPQVPSVETLAVEAGAADVLVEVAGLAVEVAGLAVVVAALVEAEEEPQVPKPD
jgi:hypothetical protein